MKTVIVPIVATLAIQAFGSMALLTLPVLAPAAAPDFGIDPSQIGFYTGICYIAASTGSLLSGEIILRYGPTRISQFCLILGAVGVALLAFGNPFILPLCALCAGAAYGPMTPASSHILARRAPPRLMTLVFSLKQTGVPAGGVIAGIALPPLALAFDWQAAVLAAAAMCALAALLLEPARAGMDDDRGRPFEFTWRSVTEPLKLNLRHPPLRRLAMAAVAFAAMQVSFLSFFVTYLIHQVEISLITAGAIFSAAQIAAVVGRILWGALADSLVPPRLMVVGLAIGMSGLALVFAAFTPDWPVMVIAVVSVLLSATAVGWNGVIIAEVARRAPAGQVSEATAGFMSINFLGVVVGPSGVSLLVGLSGSYALGFGVLAAFTAAIALMFLRPGALEARKSGV